MFRGQRIDRYEVEAPLGQGGMGEVWSATHLVLGLRRALKVLSARVPASVLMAEARLQARLDHPHVVPIIDVLEHEGRPILVMPLVKGPTLRDVLADGPLPPGQALHVFLGILAGVEHAHHHAIAHRDLKPSNVLMHLGTRTAVPRVADFGIAARAGSPPDPAGHGTPGLSPPEAGTRPVSLADDYWALGALLSALAGPHEPSLAEVAALLRHPDPDRRLVHAAALRTALATTEVVPVPVPSRALSELHRRSDGPETRPTAEVPALPQPPRPRDAFIGRWEELEGLLEALDRPGPIAVVGPGGSGKSRLLAEVGRSLTDAGRPTAFIASFEPDRQGMIDAIAEALGVSRGRGARDAPIGPALASRGSLVLLLDPGSAPSDGALSALQTWLQQAPELRVVIASRARVQGIENLVLDGLDTHPTQASPALELFLTRLRVADPTRRISQAGRDAIIELVRRLDGLPGAIELAASLGQPEQVLNRLKLPVSGTASPEVLGLATMVARSWEHLDADLRATLAQLSVFEGGFSVAAARFVVRLPQPGARVDDHLVALVDRSLVRRVEGDSRLALRFTVQVFARARLSPEQAHQAEQRHASWLSRLVDLQRFHRRGHGARRRRVSRDLPNLRVALSRARAREDWTCAEALAATLSAVTASGGPDPALLHVLEELPDTPTVLVLRARQHALALRTARAEAALQRALDEADPLDPARLEALLVLAGLWWDDDAERALPIAQEGLGLARRLNRTETEAKLLNIRATIAAQLGEDGEPYLRACIELARSLDLVRLEAMARANLGVRASRGPDTSATRRHYLAALSLYTDEDDQPGQVWVSQNLALLHLREGDLEAARLRLDRAMAWFRATGDRRTEGRRHKLSARIHLAAGHTEAARQALEHGDTLLTAIHDEQGWGLLQLGWAELLHAKGNQAGALDALERATQALAPYERGRPSDEIERVRLLITSCPA